MKTIIDKATKESIYIAEDSETIVIGSQSLSIGDPVHTIFSDLNSGNAEVIENVTPPSDWFGRKYKLVDGSWILA